MQDRSSIPIQVMFVFSSGPTLQAEDDAVVKQLRWPIANC